MSDKNIVLITGGNTGIGYEVCKALYNSSEPYTILMGSRSLDKAKTAIAQLQKEKSNSGTTIVSVQIDIEDDKSIDNAVKEVESKYGRVDTLINNAGGSLDMLLRDDPSANGIRKAWDKTYSLNVTSTQVFTTAFVPLLLASNKPRLLFVTSGLSSLTTCSQGAGSKLVSSAPPKGWPKPFRPSAVAYRSSKTALNMMVLDWHNTLQVDGVKVFNISPGFLATGLGGVGADQLKQMGAGHPSSGAEFIRDVVEGKRDGDEGKVINKDGVQPW